MNTTLKPTLKRILPLIAATTVTLSTAVANQHKTGATTEKFDNLEYLQADKYEKQGDNRINSGLNQDLAYKDEALKAKFDQANLKKDYEITEEEALIYNWSRHGFKSLNDDILQNGAVLRGVDRTIHSRDKVFPHFYIYPEQEFSSLYLPKQKQIFKQLDLNNDQKASASEILRYAKTLELQDCENLIESTDAEIVNAKKHLANKKDAVDWGHSIFLSSLISTLLFLGLVPESKGKKAAIGTGLSLVSFLSAMGFFAHCDISKNNKRFNSKIENATTLKNNTITKKEVLMKELNYLNEQLRIENLK